MMEAARPWTLIILAGQRPGTDPLAAHFGLTMKALVPIAGAAMLTRVVRTGNAAPGVARVLVLAQAPAALADAITAGGGAQTHASGAGISTSIRAIAGSAAAPWPILITTADHPLLTPAMIAAFIAGAGDADVAVAMVERTAMLERFPDARRTWLRLADGAWSGANLFALRTPAAGAALDAWARAEQDRKRPWRLFRHFGLILAIRAITRTIGLGDALARAGRRLGLTARLVPMADPEAAIDVDKLADYGLAEQLLLSSNR